MCRSYLAFIACLLTACSVEAASPAARPEGAARVHVEAAAPITVRRLDDLNGVLEALSGAPALIELPPGRHALSAPILLPSHTRLSGAGQGVTVLVARGRLDSVITGPGEGANAGAITVSDLTVDCADRAADGVSFRQVAGLALSRVTAMGCTRTGVRISGHGVPTRGATLSDITVERNRGDGMMVLWASRNVRYTNIFAYANGGAGIVFDHSEGAAANIVADQNGGDGIFFRNLFAFSAANLTATRNGRNGVLARGFVASTGQGWVSMGNSLSAPGRFDEIRFTAEDDLSYGVTRDSALANVIVGAYEAGTGPGTAGRGLAIDPGVGPLAVNNVVTKDLAPTVPAG